MVSYYIDSGVGIHEIAKIFKVGIKTVNNYLKEYEITKRTFSEQLKLSTPSGKDHFNWKGGRRVTPQGYIKILMPDHHRADSYGYVCEHIVIWEIANQKILPDGYVIHHLNGIKGDNRPENLVALLAKNHHGYMWHTVLIKHIQKLESQITELNKKIGELNGTNRIYEALPQGREIDTVADSNILEGAKVFPVWSIPDLH